jgi:hypothetical protein
MYKFKKEKYFDLLDGRTVEWLSREVGYSSTMLYLIFNGHKNCKKALAIAIVTTLDKDSNIEEYFEEIR